MIEKITSVWAFVAMSPDGEGIPGCMVQDTVFPLVATTPDNVERMRVTAHDTAVQYGVEVQFRRFDLVEVIETFPGDQSESE